MKYQEKKFSIDPLNGISEKQIGEHLKLYSGYVKHTNLIGEKISQLSEDKENNSYIMSELRRRFSFEFNGMRMHEYYFEQFEGGFKEKNEESRLVKFIGEQSGDAVLAIERFKDFVATTRGIGWAVVSYDKVINKIQMNWVDSHEIGQLVDLDVILVIDMWEHAFLIDYIPSEKNKYIEAFFDNLNWGVLEKRFDAIIKERS